MTNTTSMDPATLEALRGSIRKWEAIVAGTGTDNGPDNCPLCRMFHSEYFDDGDDTPCCLGCPVADAVKNTGCAGTPYEDYDNAEPDSQEQHDHAERELAFLKSLLPKEAS